MTPPLSGVPQRAWWRWGLAGAAVTLRACAILREVATEHPLVDEVVDSRVADVTVDGTMLLVRVPCKGTLQGREITFAVLETARERFDEEGIDLAYRYRNRVAKPGSSDGALLDEVVQSDDELNDSVAADLADAMDETASPEVQP